MRTKARVDSNQKEVVKAIENFGGIVLHTHQLKNCFDILVFWDQQIFAMEIKDGSKPPSQRKLTEGELEFKNKIESVGCDYHVVLCPDDAIDILICGSL